MLTKFLCKTFNLISKDYIVNKLIVLTYRMETSKDALKMKYDTKELSEWSYYKKMWILKGRLKMLDELIDLLK